MEDKLKEVNWGFSVEDVPCPECKQEQDVESEQFEKTSGYKSFAEAIVTCVKCEKQFVVVLNN